jgi:CheY-like chemotaxis protein
MLSLFLEDEGMDFDEASSGEEALARVGEGEYDLILLDHDLREEHYFSDEPDDDRTGYAVAAWLAARPDSQPGAQIIIHSLNYSGAPRMRDALIATGFDAEWIPFHYLQSGLRF